ncbi:MAG: hypothetical protein QNJ40_20510 [Xanthomonadales bacterium]|nr:hypothetical protein [Xanthomonadales bacterium]
MTRSTGNTRSAGASLLAVLLLTMTAPALGSDYTGFFVLFLEIPILVISLLFLPLCFLAPKVGLALATMLLLGIFVVLYWASDVGYMSTAGGLLLLSLVINVIGIAVAAKKAKLVGKASPDDKA